MKRFLNKKAQTFIEYTMILIIVAAGLLLMQHYIKRGTQGRLRQAADSIGDQYDAHNITSSITMTQLGVTNVDTYLHELNSAEAEEGKILGVITSSSGWDRTNRRGNENVAAFPNDLFD